MGDFAPSNLALSDLAPSDLGCQLFGGKMFRSNFLVGESGIYMKMMMDEKVEVSHLVHLTEEMRSTTSSPVSTAPSPLL